AANRLAAHRGGHLAPLEERLARGLERAVVLLAGGRAHGGDHLPGRRVDGLDQRRLLARRRAGARPGAGIGALEPESLQDVVHCACPCPLRWCPVSPLATSSAESWLLPPCA